MPPIIRTVRQIYDEEQSEKRGADLVLKKVANQLKPAELGLASYVKQCFEEARSARDNVQETGKKSVTDRMLASARQRRGEYDDDKLANIRAFGHSDVFMNVTNVKCRAAESWLRDILGATKDTPFLIEPTPQPDLPRDITDAVTTKVKEKIMANPEIMSFSEIFQYQDQLETALRSEIKEEAKERTEKMTVRISDIITEGGWENALNDVIHDIVTYPAGFMKGPIFRKKQRIDWVLTEEGEIKSRVGYDVIMEFDRVSPFDMYPSPNSTGINDGYLIQRHRLTRRKLEEMRGLPGYRDDLIEKALNEYTRGSNVDWISPLNDEVRKAEEHDNTMVQGNDTRIDALEFWGDVSGKMLIEWGMSPNVIKDKEKQYQVCAWLIGSYVIKAVLNPHPLGKRPYQKASFERNEVNSFWGQGVPELMSDVQDVCNATARALVNNMAFASGPQVSVDVNNIDPASDYTNIYPLKIWLTDSGQELGDTGSKGKPIDFFQPDPMASMLLTVFESFSKYAEEYTGIPSYTYGMANVGGAARALADYEKVWTSEGAVEIGRLQKGCLVNNTYGSFSKVTGVYPQGERAIFRMKFSDGEHVDCDLEHRWSVRTHHGRKFQTLTTAEILKKGLFRKTIKGKKNPKGYRPKWMLPKVDAVEFRGKEIKIDPYTMGALLGNGDSRCRLTCLDKEIFDRIPYHLGEIDKKKDNKASTRTIKGIKSDYHSYGLKCKSIEKFIPKDYLYNSKEVRMELLHGLMDTDGCCDKEGKTFYSSSSYKLINDVKTLVKSLGANANGICEEEAGEFEIRGKKSYRQKNYRLTFYMPNKDVFHLERKQKRVKEKRTKRHIYIVGIEYLKTHHATCITVDSDNKLFLCENFIPTHNTAAGLSMLISAAGKIIKSVMANIDRFIISESVTRVWEYLMLFDDDQSIKGDAQIIARGSSALVAKEALQIRRQEFLNMTNNPVDNAIVGIKGRAEILRQVMLTLDIDVDAVIPDIDSVMEREAAFMQNAGTNTGSQTPAPSNVDLAGNRPQGADTAVFAQGRG